MVIILQYWIIILYTWNTMLNVNYASIFKKDISMHKKILQKMC